MEGSLCAAMLPEDMAGGRMQEQERIKKERERNPTARRAVDWMKWLCLGAVPLLATPTIITTPQNCKDKMASKAEVRNNLDEQMRRYLENLKQPGNVALGQQKPKSTR